MLEEAVKSLKEHGAEDQEEQWSPTINVGLPVLLPEPYVPDLQVRLGLYRRLSGCMKARTWRTSQRAGGPLRALPEEVKHLLTVVQIKNYCRRAGISQVDAGPKGAVISFRNKRFANPQGLVKFMHDNGAAVKLQPDHKLVFRAEWDDGVERLRGARALVRELADVAERKSRRCRRLRRRGHAAAQYRQDEAAASRRKDISIGPPVCQGFLRGRQGALAPVAVTRLAARFCSGKPVSRYRFITF